MAAANLVTSYERARRSGVPLIGITTSDPTQTLQKLLEIEQQLADIRGRERVTLKWDGGRGFSVIVAEGDKINEGLAFTADTALGKMLGEKRPDAIFDAADALYYAKDMPAAGVLFFQSLDRYWNTSTASGDVASKTIQNLWNLRDEYKGDGRMLVILAPDINLPPELSQDVIVFDDPFPTRNEVEQIIVSLHESAAQQVPARDTLEHVIDAARGGSAFNVEQIVSLSMSEKGIDLDTLVERKCKMIEQVKGLSPWRGTDRRKDVGGCDHIFDYGMSLLSGPERPVLLVFEDEIEKMMPDASYGGDGGVGKDMLGRKLSFMEDARADGMIFVGPPGAAKTMVARALGNEANIMIVGVDYGAVRAGIVGESESNFRTLLKTLTALSDGRMLFIATSNKISMLPPELLRRYTMGTFFFDLPSQVERDQIWAKQLAAHGHPLDSVRPVDVDWTGAEIRNCCHIAKRTGKTLVQAAKNIVPVAKSGAENLAELRRNSTNTTISASTGEIYQWAGANVGTRTPNVTASARRGRQFDLN